MVNMPPLLQIGSFLVPLTVLAVISIIIFYGINQYLNEIYSIGLTILISALIAKLMYKMRIFQNALYTVGYRSLTDAEEAEYSFTTPPPTFRPVKELTVKEWKKLYEDAKDMYLHEFDVILTDHQTLSEKALKFLRKFNNKNYDISTGMYHSIVSSIRTFSKSHPNRKYTINPNGFNVNKPINNNLFGRTPTRNRRQSARQSTKQFGFGDSLSMGRRLNFADEFKREKKTKSKKISKRADRKRFSNMLSIGTPLSFSNPLGFGDERKPKKKSKSKRKSTKKKSSSKKKSKSKRKPTKRKSTSTRSLSFGRSSRQGLSLFGSTKSSKRSKSTNGGSHWM